MGAATAGDQDGGLVAWLAAARRGERLPPPVGSAWPGERAAALRVQAEVARALGAAVAGWKAGFGPDGAPAFAPIFASDVRQSGQTFALALPDAGALEVEVAFVLARDVTRADATSGREKVLAAVDRIVLGLEILQPRVVGQAAFAAGLADNLGNAGYVIGPDLPREAAEGTGPELVLDVDGVEVYAGPGRHPQGDVVLPLVALAEALGDHLGGLRAGQFVTTGNLLPKPHPLARSAAVRARGGAAALDVALTLPAG